MLGRPPFPDSLLDLSVVRPFAKQHEKGGRANRPKDPLKKGGDLAADILKCYKADTTTFALDNSVNLHCAFLGALLTFGTTLNIYLLNLSRPTLTPTFS
jgi:hypothetical protein